MNNTVMQNLKAEVTITIPKDMVLVNRVDYEDLKRQAEEVKTWSVSELMDSLERLDRRSLHLFEAALKGGE